MDLSPISIKNLMNAFHPYGLMSVHMTYPVKRFSTLARVGGIGYRSLAKLDHSRNLHFERIYAMWTKHSLPFEILLGRGLPLNPGHHN